MSKTTNLPDLANGVRENSMLVKGGVQEALSSYGVCVATIRNLIRLGGSKSSYLLSRGICVVVSLLNLIQKTHLTKLKDRKGLYTPVSSTRIYIKGRYLIGGIGSNMGYPESRKAGGYGGLVVVGTFPMKGASSIRRFYRISDASDREKLGFSISDDNKITNILKQVGSLINLLAAYDTIKSKPGNITPGVDNKTLDGMRIEKLCKLSSDLLRGRFLFKPSRRVIIPKKAGGERPLSIPSPLDKVVHQAIRQQLNMVFEPLFINSSHGFRPNRGCHRAFNQIKIEFSNIN